MTQIFVNNWSTTITAPVAASDDFVQVSTSDLQVLINAGLPSSSGDDFIVLTLANADTGIYECLKVIEYSGQKLLCQRAQEGTAAAAWSSGSTIYAALTAKPMASIQARLEALESADSGGSSGGSGAKSETSTSNELDLSAYVDQKALINWTPDASDSGASLAFNNDTAGNWMDIDVVVNANFSQLRVGVSSTTTVFNASYTDEGTGPTFEIVSGSYYLISVRKAIGSAAAISIQKMA